MMKRPFYFITAVWICCLLATPRLFAQQAGSGISRDEITLENTEVLTLRSEINEHDYEIWISLPRSYSSGSQQYPVIVLTDAFRLFLITKGMMDVFTNPYTLVPESILVGIGYGGGPEATPKWAVGRTRDLTPVEDTAQERTFATLVRGLGYQIDEVETGGAQAFMAFIRQELLPYMDEHFRTDPEQRMLMGYSFGGLFGCYVLFHDPELFDMYLLGSPSLHYGDEITFRYEEDYAAEHEDLDAKVFISSGELEEYAVPRLERFDQQLRSREYKHLYLRKVIFEDESHVTCGPAAISRGLVTLFQEEKP